MQLGAVCDRTIDGEVYEFGTAGYTMNNVFVIYDRNTDSVWYPLSDNTFDAVSGPDKGKTIEFLAKPEVMRLHEWAAMHPETLVLIPPPRTNQEQQRRERFVKKLVGEWDMTTDFNGQPIVATMTIEFDGEGFNGTWTSMGQDMEMLDIRYNGERLKFGREIPGGMKIEYTGRVGDGTITGTWASEMGNHDCSGKKMNTESIDETPASQPDQ